MVRQSAFIVLLASGVWGSTLTAKEVELNGHVFTLPDGFEIELAAGPPLVERPITAAFDEQGRLYVADSSGSNDKVDKQLAERPHRIVRLEDSDGDGRFDKSIVFADKMMFPEGTMWYDGSLYVTAPPSIWKLTDTDGDGVADKREEWFAGKTLTGCANDLHGPYLGPDGWIYWCKGAFAKQTYEQVGKPLQVIAGLPNDILGKPQPADKAPVPASMPTWSTRASHIFRCRPDGTGLEPVMTGGMDNPVDAVFLPNGDRFFTTTFLVHPGNGQRDGLIHAIYGGVYGKDHAVLDGHPRTGELMPVLSHMGAAAPCGLTRYESNVFGDEFQDNLFACQFNKHKVSRHLLQPVGASYASQDSDFVVSTNVDFHPTDVLEDADGSLLIVDTGGWYKLCCPTSQLHKPDILGGIYRVRKVGAKKIDDPRGLKIDWSQFSAYLPNDDRPAVRQRAIHVVSQRYNREGTNADVGMQRQLAGDVAQLRMDAVWTLTRMQGESARELVKSLLTDRQESVRQAALHAVSLWRLNDSFVKERLFELLERGTPRDRRLAAECLGRSGDKSAVPKLLAASSRVELDGAGAGAAPAPAVDRALEHAFIYALIELADPAATAKGLASDNSHVRRVALIALDQMVGGGISPRQVTPLLAASDPLLKQAANWIVGHHPAWGGELAGHLRDRLQADKLSDSDTVELAGQLAGFARAAEVQELLADTIQTQGKPAAGNNGTAAAMRVALRAMREAGLKETPNRWIAALTQIVNQGDAELLPFAVATLRGLSPPKENVSELAAALMKIARQQETPATVRIDALAAVPGGLSSVEPDVFAFLLGNIGPETPVAVRSAAADVLAKAKLSREQLTTLAQSLKLAGPLEVDRLLAAFEQTTDEALGLQLLLALKGSPVLAALRVDSLRQRIAKYSPRVQDQAQELYTLIKADVAKQRERLEEMLTSLPAGDIRRGQTVFMSAKAACAACHAIGYLGGKIGPDLTHIGGIRNDRDLLESIAFPSASFVRSYESVTVVTNDGKVVNGILRKDSADEVVLAINATEEVRVPREAIEEMRLSTVSVMPSGLDQQLTREQLADLVAFLRAAK